MSLVDCRWCGHPCMRNERPMGRVCDECFRLSRRVTKRRWRAERRGLPRDPRPVSELVAVERRVDLMRWRVSQGASPFDAIERQSA